MHTGTYKFAPLWLLTRLDNSRKKQASNAIARSLQSTGTTALKLTTLDDGWLGHDFVIELNQAAATHCTALGFMINPLFYSKIILFKKYRTPITRNGIKEMHQAASTYMISASSSGKSQTLLARFFLYSQ